MAGLFSVSKVFSQIFAEVWKWAALADRDRFLTVYNKFRRIGSSPEVVGSESFLETICEEPRAISDPALRQRRKRRKIDTPEIILDLSPQQKQTAEKVLEIIEREIRLARPFPKQRQSYLRLTPLPTLEVSAYISSQAWERYKVIIDWYHNMDIRIDLYPDY